VGRDIDGQLRVGDIEDQGGRGKVVICFAIGGDCTVKRYRPGRTLGRRDDWSRAGACRMSFARGLPIKREFNLRSSLELSGQQSWGKLTQMR
jgi:hypothetical protein